MLLVLRGGKARLLFEHPVEGTFGGKTRFERQLQDALLFQRSLSDPAQEIIYPRLVKQFAEGSGVYPVDSEGKPVRMHPQFFGEGALRQVWVLEGALP